MVMNEEQQLRLQAFLDGELPEKEAREVASWVARDRDAANLVKELRNTRRALANSAPRMRVPETREFYWSKIEREIQRLEPAAGAPAAPTLLARWRRLLMPASVLAALAIIAVVAGRQSGLLKPSGGRQTEMTVADAGTFTYHDYANGTTLVWVSYPAER
jgi:anti-sigma factor RsiW